MSSEKLSGVEKTSKKPDRLSYWYLQVIQLEFYTNNAT